MSIFGGIGSWIEQYCGELQLGVPDVPDDVVATSEEEGIHQG